MHGSVPNGFGEQGHDLSVLRQRGHTQRPVALQLHTVKTRVDCSVLKRQGHHRGGTVLSASQESRATTASTPVTRSLPSEYLLRTSPDLRCFAKEREAAAADTKPRARSQAPVALSVDASSICPHAQG